MENYEPEIIAEIRSPVKSILASYTVGSYRDDFDPYKITLETNIKPTKVYRKGEDFIGSYRCHVTGLMKEAKEKRTNSIWEIDTSDITSLKIDDHLEYLLSILEPKADTFKRIINNNDKSDLIRFVIFIKSIDDDGGFEVNSEILKRMGTISHRVWFEFFGNINDDTL